MNNSRDAQLKYIYSLVHQEDVTWGQNKEKSRIYFFCIFPLFAQTQSQIKPLYGKLCILVCVCTTNAAMSHTGLWSSDSGM